MNKRLQGFIGGFLAAIILLVSVPVLAASIDVSFNPFNIFLNGKKIANKGENYTLYNGEEVPFSIVYKGTTYLPLRKISELIGKEVQFASETGSIHLSDPIAPIDEQLPNKEGDSMQTKPVTKKELAKFFVETFQPETKGSNRIFIDVPETDPYYEYVVIAVNNEYLNGSNYRFFPDMIITREMYAAYLCNVLNRLNDEYTPNGIKDIYEANGLFWPSIEIIVGLGLMDLYEDGTFRPKEPLMMDLTPNPSLKDYIKSN